METVAVLLELLHGLVRGDRQLVLVFAHHVGEHVLQRQGGGKVQKEGS